MSALATLVGRAGRHAAVYALNYVIVAVLGIATIAVYTRYMSPSEFGVLTVLLAQMSLLTLVFSIGLIQGCLGAVFRETDDEDGAGDLLGDDDPSAGVVSKKDLLGASIALVVLFSIAIAGFGVLYAQELARLVLHDAGRAPEMRLAALAAGLAGPVRLLSAVPRFERRPNRFVVLNAGLPLLSIAFSLPFVAAGEGAQGALKGLILATGVLAVGALVLMRRSFRLRLRWPSLVLIVRMTVLLGAVFVPLKISLWVIQQSGALLLTRFVSTTDIGYFRAASTFPQLLAHITAIFFMAWLPLKRTSLAVAAHKEKGGVVINAGLVTWFSIAVATILVLIVATGDALVVITGSAYAPAASLIPSLGVAALAQAMFLLTYRIVTFPGKRIALAVVPVIAAGIFVGTAFELVPSLGVRGIAVAGSIAFGFATLVMVVLGQRGPLPLPYDYGRLGRLTLIVVGCLGAHAALGGSSRSGAVVDVALVIAYGALLFGLRIVPAHQARILARIGWESVRPERRDRAALERRLVELPPKDAAVLARALAPNGDRDAPAPEEVVSALREVGQAGTPTAHDGAIGNYLLAPVPPAERDVMARALWKERVDPWELHRLEHTVEALRRIPARRWRAIHPELRDDQLAGR